MGDAFGGIIHPCKIYNILTIGCPFLYIGPSASHVVDILKRLGDSRAAVTANHGDVDSVVEGILERARGGDDINDFRIREIAADYSGDFLLPQMIDLLGPARLAAHRTVPPRDAESTVGLYSAGTNRRT
jgi:colanic acid biosynthesis glycosyl transferase WcaI